MLTTQQQQKAIGFLLQKKQNSLCADCNGKSPCWASLDFGVFVCMNCSGAHRALGPSITRVKSTKLDMWNREWLQNMKIGNSVLNQYWENQLVGIARASKPNINTSLSDIIKYVNDKYVKRKYVDPNQSFDPLKRSKLQPQPPKPQPEVNQPKQTAKIANNNNDSPFNAFNTIINSKQKPQRKSSDNLINFQKEVAKKPEVQNSNHQPKYNHAQFHTISGSKPKQQQNLINFQSLTKNIEHSHQQTQNTHSNFLLNPHSHHYHNNQGHYSTGHYDSHYHPNIPQYDRTQYVTMNINMNMYPKVMNINMNPQNTTNNNYLPTPPNNHFANQFLGQSETNKKPPQNEVKITLDSNINLDSVGRQKKQQAKSWIDQWK